MGAAMQARSPSSTAGMRCSHCRRTSAGYAARNSGSQVPTAPRPVPPTNGFVVLVPVGGRPMMVQVERDPDLGSGYHPPKHLYRSAVRQQQVVRRSHGVRLRTPSRGVHPGAVAQPGHHPRLDMGHPLRHPVPEMLPDDPGVVREGLHGGPGRPAPLVFQGLGEVPVVQDYDRLDPLRSNSASTRRS